MLMSYEFRANPFETSSADKAANLARVQAEREALDEIRGFGNPGVVGGIINNTIGERPMDSHTAHEAAERAFGDPNAIIGGLAAGAAELPKSIRGKISRS